jgi:hypothetical protein
LLFANFFKLLLFLAFAVSILARKLSQMEKTLSLTLATLIVALISCTSIVDKRINKETFLQDIQEIHKKTGNLYTDDDYTNLVLGIGVGNVMGLKGIDGTYHEALDSIKATRERRTADSTTKAQKYQQELKVYMDKVGQLAKVIAVTVLAKGSQSVDNIDQQFVFGYHVTSGASQIVTAFQGSIVIIGESGKVLYAAPVDSYNDAIEPGKGYDFKEAADYDSTDGDQSTAMNTPLEKLRFKWMPSKIVFKDGTTLTAPDAPNSPE